MRKDKLEELEFRIFELEQNVELLTKKIINLTDQIGFYYQDDVEENQSVKREDLLTLTETAQILDQSVSTINEWVLQNKIKAVSIANKFYFDKDEVKKVFRQIMLDS